MRRLLLALPLLLVALPAQADSGMLTIGVANRQMPLDPPFAAQTAAYSFRRLKTAYVINKAVNIRRASDSGAIDVGFVPDGGFDTVAASTHCAATSCFVVTWYDQSGNTRNLTQATAGNQPPLVFNCQGALACLNTTNATMTLAAAANITPATGLVSFSTVANRSAGTAACVWMRENAINNRLSSVGAATTWRLTGGTSGTVDATATDAAWHSYQAVLNAASSVVSLDGTETTGTATGNTIAGAPVIIGSASTTCRWGEAVIWDNYALTAGERVRLVANQRSFWGF